MDTPNDPLADAGLEQVTDDTDDVPTPAGAVPADAGSAAPAPTDGAGDDDVVDVPEGADNPGAVERLIKNERKAARDANARARALEAQLQQQKDEAKPLEQRIEEAASKAEQAELRALRFEVAAETGIDLQLASRLSGTTRDELVTDAETLKGLVGAKPATPAVPPEGGYKQSPPEKKDPAREHDNALVAILTQKQQQRGAANPFSGLEPAPED